MLGDHRGMVVFSVAAVQFGTTKDFRHEVSHGAKVIERHRSENRPQGRIFANFHVERLEELFNHVEFVGNSPDNPYALEKNLAVYINGMEVSAVVEIGGSSAHCEAAWLP